MKKTILFAMLAVLGAVSGCMGPDPVVFAEVFQLKENQKLYTAYNLWYEDPANIDCRNIQRGSMLPLGSEIIPVGTSADGKINFKDTKGKLYTIRFSDGLRLCNMSEFVAYTFTTKNRKELLKGIPRNIASRICRGEVVPGMTPAQVELAYGPPPACRTPEKKLNESWIYFVTDSASVRVIFRSGRVRSVLNLDEKF